MVFTEGSVDAISQGPGTVAVSVASVVADLGDKAAGSVENFKTGRT